MPWGTNRIVTMMSAARTMNRMGPRGAISSLI